MYLVNWKYLFTHGNEITRGSCSWVTGPILWYDIVIRRAVSIKVKKTYQTFNSKKIPHTSSFLHFEAETDLGDDILKFICLNENSYIVISIPNYGL